MINNLLLMALALALALVDIERVSRSIRIFISFHDFVFHSVRIDAKLIAFDFHHITFNCRRSRVRLCETQLCANSEQIQAIMGEGVKHKKSAPLGSCREPIVSVGFCLWTWPEMHFPFARVVTTHQSPHLWMQASCFPLTGLAAAEMKSKKRKRNNRSLH